MRYILLSRSIVLEVFSKSDDVLSIDLEDPDVLKDFNSIFIGAMTKQYTRDSEYERLIWDYKNADVPSINRAIDIFDWGNSFEGKNVHEQVHFFNKTILNIFHNYIPNKTILCNDKDLPWFNNEIRNILTMKNKIFEQYIANGKSQIDYERLQLISNSLTETIRSSKEKFYFKLSTKLANPSTSSKTYWSILKTFVNGKKIQ